MDLKPQRPAIGIMQTANGPEFKMYKIDCSCGNPDDTIEFSVDGSDGEVIVQTYTTQKTAWWADPFKKNKSFEIRNQWLFQINYYVRGFLNSLAHRLKVTWEVWVQGYVKYSQSTIMTPQQALNYSEALRLAVKDVHASQEKINHHE